ncbi:unnamed protein product [Microthlaspi erraticum]|uniref:Uncharacterized protein n=1 Tax=Microthlaspi erraticum TaxID=1685480 RepID=A0A6D2IM28_9BRAS|nr:unnamed protein product [Microthlaspi erraticum]
MLNWNLNLLHSDLIFGSASIDGFIVLYIVRLRLGKEKQKKEGKRLSAPTSIFVTGFILFNHATESLESSFIEVEPPWGDFPVTRAAAEIFTMVEVFALASMNRSPSETWRCIVVRDIEEEKIHVDNSCSLQEPSMFVRDCG